MMRLMKFLLSGLLLSASFGVQAVEYNLGSLPDGYTLFGHNIVHGSFLDKVNFNLSAPANTSFGAGALNFSVGGPQFLNIDGLALSLFSESGTLLGNGLNFTVGALGGGNYTLQVSGLANGVYGGLYAGGINVTPVTIPVPEPEPWKFLLAGFAMLGLMAFRRRGAH